MALKPPQDPFAQPWEGVRASLARFLESFPGLIVILGATGSGKTTQSIRCAQWIKAQTGRGAEVISVDSRQIFRGINVAVAKITPQEMDGIPHHGLDLKEPHETSNAREFQQYAFQTIDQILERGNWPILCGGTMLWLDAITENYQFSAENSAPPRWPVFHLGLTWPRAQLYQRLDQRALEQWGNGLIEETQYLQQLELPPSRNLWTSFGYQEVSDYLAGKRSAESAIAENQKRNHHYARRQLIWWRGRSEINWVDGSKIQF